MRRLLMSLRYITKRKGDAFAPPNLVLQHLLLLDHFLGPLHRFTVPAFLPELRLVPIPLQALPACVGARVATAVHLLGALSARNAVHFVRHRNLPCYLYFTLLLSHHSHNSLPVLNHPRELSHAPPPVGA
jgi:hypothetical protein